MMSDDRGIAIGAMRSSTFCGMLMRSSAKMKKFGSPHIRSTGSLTANPGAGGQNNNAGATRSIRRSARPTVARGGGRHTGDNALAYPYPANVPGWSSGDLSTMSGCVAWHLSVGDLLTVMAAFRRRGVIVDRPSWLLDAFALALTDRISGMASGAAGRARISHKVCDCEPLHTFPGSAGLASPHTKTV